MEFSLIEITWMIHATEDGEKVVKKMIELFPLSIDDIKYSNLEGHFGNPLIIYKIRLTGSKVDEFVQSLFSFIKDVDKKILERELPKHLDKCGAFYIRIDKQLLCKGKIALSEKDAIRIKLKPKNNLNFNEKLLHYRRLLK
ncbi:MAG: RNA-binding domain-containing protein [Nitrososphaerales archaeon]